MSMGSEARKVAREQLGVTYPVDLGRDADGVSRVSCAASRADDSPSGMHCGECGLEFTLGYRPDPCMGGYLPGVAHACCGHGEQGRAYVCGGECVPDQNADTIRDKWRLHGREALDYIARNRHLATLDP